MQFTVGSPRLPSVILMVMPTALFCNNVVGCKRKLPLRESRRQNEMLRANVAQLIHWQKVMCHGFERPPSPPLGERGVLRRTFGEIEGCLHQNHIFAVRCFRHKLLPKFLTYITAATYGPDCFEAAGKSTTNLASTNATKVGAFPIPLSLITEQEAICTYLDAKLSEMKFIIIGIEAQIDTLTAYRKSPIHECVTAQRRVSEADVAPARRAESESMRTCR